MRSDDHILPTILLLTAFIFYPTKGNADDSCKANFQHYVPCLITQQSTDNSYSMSCTEMQSVIMKAFDNTASTDGVEVSESVIID